MIKWGTKIGQSVDQAVRKGKDRGTRILTKNNIMVRRTQAVRLASAAYTYTKYDSSRANV